MSGTVEQTRRLCDIGRNGGTMRDWVHQAIGKIEADFQRSADTHLFRLDLPELDGIDIYLKDESTHPTGSLKHRLARSLFLYALCNGRIREGQPVIEASSGSTAVSEAYFARMLGLRFIAVMPHTTAQPKIDLIRFYGGECHFVGSAPEMHDAAVALADETGGCFMDQFMYAERATDWRGNNNIAESIFTQMAREPHPIPAAIVMSAGTGGTSATLGRYVRYRSHPTELVVVDPENSVFYDSYQTGDLTLTRPCSSRIEGIGRPQGGAFVPAWRHRPDDAGPRCRQHRRHPVAGGAHRPQGGTIDGNEPLGHADVRAADAGGGAQRVHRHASVRQRAALSGHLLQSRLGDGEDRRYQPMAGPACKPRSGLRRAGVRDTAETARPSAPALRSPVTDSNPSRRGSRDGCRLSARHIPDGRPRPWRAQ